MPATVKKAVWCETRGRLLHVVGHDHDRVLLDQLVHQVLDRERRDRVERRAGLVHQDDLGLDRDRARDAQALLLAAREREARPGSSLSLTSSQSAAPGAGPPRRARRWPSRPLTFIPKRQVVLDRLRERVGLLEDHPDAPAHVDRVDVGRVEVLARGTRGPALDAGAGDQVVHAVQAAQEGRLAAARGADERRDLVAAGSRSRCPSAPAPCRRRSPGRAPRRPRRGSRPASRARSPRAW